MGIINHINEFVAHFCGSIVRNGGAIVSVVRLNGSIGASGVSRRGLNLASLEQPLKRAFSRRGVHAVALIVNSPGGSAVQSALIADRIRQLAKERDVPVYAFTEAVAASGGYWLACSADEIYANPMSIVGSVGVIAATFGFHELIEKIGIERRLYAQGDNKSMLDPFRPEDPDDVKRLLDLQKDIHAQFKSYVKLRRGNRLKGTDKVLFNGDVWTGEKALKKGLIDGLGEMRSVLENKLGKKVRFIKVQKETNWLQRRLSRGIFHVDEKESWANDFLYAIEERAIWSRYGL